MSSITLPTLYQDALRSITAFLCLSEAAALHRGCRSLRLALESMRPATSLQLRRAILPHSAQRLRTWIAHLSCSVDHLLYDNNQRRLAAAVPNLTSLCLSFSYSSDETEGDLEELSQRTDIDPPAGLRSLQLMWPWTFESRALDSMLHTVHCFGAITSLTLHGRHQPFPSDPFLQGLSALVSVTSLQLLLLDRGVVQSLKKLSRPDALSIVTHPTLTSLDLQEGHLSEAFVQMLLTDEARGLRARLHYLRVDPRWITKNVKAMLNTLDGACLQLRH